MPQLKDFLTQQVSMPLSIEASLPQGAPRLSGMLSQIAANLPQTPDIPVPGGNGGQMAAFGNFGALGQFPDIANVIKGIEDAGPAGLPKLSGQLGLGGYRPIEEEAATKPATKQPKMGGGYRSIST